MKIYMLTTLGVGVDMIRVLSRSVSLAGVIGLSDRAKSDQISGYCYVRRFCEEEGLSFTEVRSYGLRDPEDQERLRSLEIDLLIVSGWQRLIPDWLIEQCRVGAIGAHGSADGIVGGRGRSPQNWALILGASSFSLSVFQITKDIDSGPVLATRVFELSQFDDIASSYQKVAWLTAEMILEIVREDKIQKNLGREQNGEARYYPQRLPEDGRIDWHRDSEEIYNFVRALTKPYPGAYTDLGKWRLKLWRARPFLLCDTEKKQCPGTIVRICGSDGFIVATGDSFLLVDESELFGPKDEESPVRYGQVLPSCSFPEQMQRIIKRHYEKYPSLMLNQRILDAAR